jgi:hypothetical protein
MGLPNLGPLLQIIETDPNWNHGDVHVTRRFVMSAALLSVAGVCVALIVLPLLYALLMPSPFEYRNLPFRVCAPQSTTSLCVPERGDPFHAGDVVPFVVDRCVNDPFVRTAEIPYIVSRNVVNAETGVRVILPSLSTSVPSSGCETSVTVAHQLPDTLAPGRYKLEGVATVYGRFRTVNAYFVTEEFNVTR